MKQEQKTEPELDVEVAVNEYDEICNKAMDYMYRFTSDNQIIELNFTLKREHINRVIGYAELISRNIELNDMQVRTVQLAALLHDIGRFEQFRRHESFNDSKTLDHAQLALEIIKQEQWLNTLPNAIHTAVTNAVLFHNKIEVPKFENELDSLVARVIRDADKIDILNMAVKEFAHYSTNNSHFFLGLENSLLISSKVVKQILNGKLPLRSTLKTVTDFKLMLMAFVFDLNFKVSYSIVNENQLLKRIFDTLPKTDHVFDVYRKTKIHVENQLV